MIKTLVLVPERDNEGRYFVHDLYAALEARLVGAFGGLSRRQGVVGMWSHEGRIYHDRSVEYTVALDQWTQLPEWLAIVDEALRSFRQEALYIEIANVPEIFRGLPRARP